MTMQRRLISIAFAAGVLAAQPRQTSAAAQQIGPHLGDKQYGESISSDGRYIGIEEHGQISVQDLRTLEEHVVIGGFNSSNEKFDSPFISPDGKQLACLRLLPEGLPDLYVLGADGSNPRVVAKSVSKLSGWSPDGRRLLATLGGNDATVQTVLLSVADGSRQTIPGVSSSLQRMSPDGRYVAFFESGTASAPGSIYTLPIRGGTPVLVATNADVDTRPAWTPDGKRLLFVRPRQESWDLWSIPVADGAPAGRARVVKDKMGRLLDVTAAGDIYYQIGNQTRDLYVAGVDAQATGLTSQPRKLTSGELPGGAAWSRDGQYLAYYIYQQQTFTVAIRSVRTGKVRKIIPKYPLNERWGLPLSLQPLWNADSRHLFLHSEGGRVGWLDTGTGEVKPLWNDNSLLPVYRDGNANQAYSPTVAISPDERTIYQLERDPAGRQTKVVRVDLQTKARSEIYRLEADQVRGFTISRDGGRLLMTRIRAVPGEPPPGAVSVVILPTVGGEATELAMFDTREGPIWSSDGRRLFSAARASNRRSEIYSMPVEGGSPQLLCKCAGMSEVFFLNASPDGTQIVFTDEHWNNRLWVLKNAFGTPTIAR